MNVRAFKLICSLYFDIVFDWTVNLLVLFMVSNLLILILLELFVCSGLFVWTAFETWLFRPLTLADPHSGGMNQLILPTFANLHGRSKCCPFEALNCPWDMPSNRSMKCLNQCIGQAKALYAARSSFAADTKSLLLLRQSHFCCWHAAQLGQFICSLNNKTWPLKKIKHYLTF